MLYFVTAPRPFILQTHDNIARYWRYSDYVQRAGGKAAHRRNVSLGRITRVDHIRYDANGARQITKDQLNRDTLVLAAPDVRLIALTRDGPVSQRFYERIFEWRPDAEAAMRDLAAWADAMRSLQVAMAH